MKTIILFSIFLIGLLLVLVFRPISNPTLRDSEIASGKVVFIKEQGGPSDIRIKLLNDEHIYYVNRGTEKGLDPEKLNEKLANEDLAIFYATHWTPLDPFGKMRHITRLTNNGVIIYDEIDN